MAKKKKESVKEVTDKTIEKVVEEKVDKSKFKSAEIMMLLK